jgi:D-alanine transaminase
MDRTAWVNGAFVAERDAVVSIFDRGFLFADGIYEVVALAAGHFVDLAGHLDRLERSCAAIRLDIPMARPALETMLTELAGRNGVTEGLVYLQVTRGPAERDFAFPAESPPTLVAYARPMRLLDHPLAGTGASAVLVPDQRWARRDIKSIALLPQVLAKQAARAAGTFEAIMVDDGHVTEGGSSTVYLVQHGAITTFPLGHDILPGITRERVLGLARALGVTVHERAFTPSDLLAADEVFITSATTFVLPIVRIDGHDIGDGMPGSLTRRLREAYVGWATASGR